MTPPARTAWRAAIYVPDAPAHLQHFDTQRLPGPVDVAAAVAAHFAQLAALRPPKDYWTASLDAWTTTGLVHGELLLGHQQHLTLLEALAEAEANPILPPWRTTLA